MSTVAILTDFAEGLNEINLADIDKKPVGVHASAIKSTISSIYDMAALESGKSDFWNWGIYDESIVRQLHELIPNFDKFDTDGFSEQLYFLALQQLPLGLGDYANKSLLEVGCGMGAGLNFLSRIIDAHSMVGLDLSVKAIERANASMSRGATLRFVEGDAEKLPFDCDSVDVIVSIESSHTYPDLGKFFAEVTRVLRAGGFLSHVDLFTKQRYQQLAVLKQAQPKLKWIHERDVSDQVRAAITRRMAPGSHFRKVFDEKKMSSITRRIGEHSRTIMFGGVFAGYQDPGFVKVLRRVGMLPNAQILPVDSYWHHVARKV